jgi:acyl-[acyl-carrier-protein]-phospholipid O-acyltransferase/long-chain-fatty-acid--[acyl-carrier-protein] ligase
VLFTTAPDADTKRLRQWGREHGVSELMIPRDIRVLERLPVLGTGKLDYVSMTTLAAQSHAAKTEDVDLEAAAK